jgi:hypothetical protein
MALESLVDELYVVEVRVPVTGPGLARASARVSKELGIPTAQVEQLLSEQNGPITRPISRDNAEEIVEILRASEVQSFAIPVEDRLAQDVPAPPVHDGFGAKCELTRPPIVRQAESIKQRRSPFRVWVRTIAIGILLLLIAVLVILRSGMAGSVTRTPVVGEERYQIGLNLPPR